MKQQALEALQSVRTLLAYQLTPEAVSELLEPIQKALEAEPKVSDVHPMQPLFVDEKGIIRFRPNKLIQHLQKIGRISLNETATLGFPAEDEQQLAQLIGYSVDGYGSLSYVDDEAWERASEAYDSIRSLRL